MSGKQVKQVKLYCKICGKIEAWPNACVETGYCVGAKNDNLLKGGVKDGK